MKDVPVLMSSNALAGSSFPVESRLKLVYSKTHRKPLHCDRCKEKQAARKRSRQIEDFASIFAREVSNPLSGLSASLQFALRDLARIPLHDSAKKRNVDFLMVEQTIHGALREVHHLVALFDDFRSRVSLGNSKRKNAGQTGTVK